MTQLAKQIIYPGELKDAYEAQLEKARKISLVNEIINRNPSVFRKKQKIHQKIISNRLGWIDLVKTMPPEIKRMEQLAKSVKEDGIRHVFVLGMGGSTLCPEVLGKVFGHKKWLASFTVVDTTAPSQLAEIIRQTDFDKAFFIVSSKSGSTLETMSQFRFFFRLMKRMRPLKAGRYFAAITDEGSDLHRIARRNRFREIFLNQRDIGGRFSALSYFGLVPGAFTNADLGGLLDAAAAQFNFMETKGNYCDALKLGTLMGVGAKSRYDKLRFLTTPKVSPFVTWVEQLVAQSTGKESKGIIPIVGDIDGSGEKFTDLLDIYYSVRGEQVGLAAPPRAAGVSQPPYVTIELPSPTTLGAEMLKWEMATAVASTVLGVNPFDEPNVAESERYTSAVLHGKRGPRKEILITPLAAYADVDIVAATGIKGLERRRHISADMVFREFFAGVRKGDYVSILCYTEMRPEIDERLIRLRRLIGTKFGLVSLRGFGPRFLHSTGQLFKGGSQTGHFLVLDREYEKDFDIPTMNVSFGRLIHAQATGDIKALRKRRRPVININLKRDPVGNLDKIIELIESL